MTDATSLHSKRILYVNHYAGGPAYGMEYRTFYLAREWVRVGHAVRVCAASFSHLRSKQPERPSRLRGLLPWTTVEGGILHDWHPTHSYLGNGLSRFLTMFAFVAWMFIAATKYVRWRPHVVIASSTYPLDIFPCWFIARLSGAKLVFEVHDLWPLSPIELGGLSRWHPFILLMQLGEDFACRHSDKIVSILPKTSEHLRGRGMLEDKFYHVPNGVALEEWSAHEQLPEVHQCLLTHLREEGVFIVGYAGSHGLSNCIDTLVGAAAGLRDDPKVAFVLVGSGPEKARLESEARAKGLGNVHFLPSLKKEQIPALLTSFDVAWIASSRSPLYRFGVSPNKVFDYMMAKRPIIQSIKAGNDLVQEASCGLSIEPEDEQALVRAILKMKSADSDVLRGFGENGYRFVQERHTYANLARSFMTCLETTQTEGREERYGLRTGTPQ